MFTHILSLCSKLCYNCSYDKLCVLWERSVLATKFAVQMGFREEDVSSNVSRALIMDWRTKNCQPNFWQVIICPSTLPISQTYKKGAGHYVYINA
ncbi:unnamed protein product [Strongylus vulgaris]|uniref:Uncharacterized protein n=1 Tax=Strongylus vulgaris TaxID=40348 RepID=A0A3P7JCI1_STRVU|nr:unnamed protein product [Strongylus vulgaris]